MWWVKDPDRLKQEVAAVEELREREAWLSAAAPRLLTKLKFAFDFDVSVNGETFPFSLEYPALFPATPPLVIPRDSRRLSAHQYGDGGELCLEYRPDNWDPAFTGAMMMASTHRLLAGERPPDEERAAVPSAHRTSQGQELRRFGCRFLLTAGFLSYATRLPPDSRRDCSVIEIAAPHRIWTAYPASAGAKDAPEWREDAIPDRCNRGDFGLLLRVDSLDDVPAVPDQETLDRLVAGTEGSEPPPPDGPAYFAVIADGTSARMFYSFAKDGGRMVIPYTAVDFADDRTGRLPESYGILTGKKVGIVGCGSLGSKIAVSLARSGVRAFVLIDDDVMKLGNLVRHELDADSLGLHKAHGLEARLKAVAASMDVSVRRVALGGQEASGSTASALDELATCDLLIDATGDPQGFNFVASVARSALRPMVWAEVYAGGIGGFVARLRPAFEPPPHAARRQYLAWCRAQGVPWQGYDRDYGTRGAEERPLVADDGDVTVIAAHATRLAVDALVRRDASLFPYPAYVIGLSQEWIFAAPFDVRPIQLVAQGPWANPASPERTVEAIEFMSSLFEEGEQENDADRTGT
jgi:sulfur-carrier protein adenylyltransferase/sulfurtransferase